MSQAFRYMRIATASALIVLTVFSFVSDAIFQANFHGLDGPLAWFSQYTQSLNRIALATLLAAVLVTDFDLKLSGLGRKICRFAAFTCIILTGIGFIYLIREHLHRVQMSSKIDTLKFLWIPYLLQVAYIMTAVILLEKTRQSSNRGGLSNA